MRLSPSWSTLRASPWLEPMNWTCNGFPCVGRSVRLAAHCSSRSSGAGNKMACSGSFVAQIPRQTAAQNRYQRGVTMACISAIRGKTFMV